MEKQTVKKIMTVSFLSAGLLTWVSVGVLFRAFAGSFGAVQQLYGNNIYSHGFPLLCGFAVFAYLQFNPKIGIWAEEVILEVGKVVWPSRKDTASMTVVVVVMVLLSGLTLFIFDNVAQFLLEILEKILT